MSVAMALASALLSSTSERLGAAASSSPHQLPSSTFRHLPHVSSAVGSCSHVLSALVFFHILDYLLPLARLGLCFLLGLRRCYICAAPSRHVSGAPASFRCVVSPRHHRQPSRPSPALCSLHWMHLWLRSRLSTSRCLAAFLCHVLGVLALDHDYLDRVQHLSTTQNE